MIRVHNLIKIYGEGENATHALRDISLEIKKGEFVAIMGPSGSGKSTLLHILGLLDKATRGEYFFDEKNSEEYSQEEIARVRNEKMGFIFQSFNLLARTTVFENIQLPLLYSQISESQWRDKTLQAIERVGLTHRLSHEPSQLSGGEQQRVAIARALVNNPQVIFADEPTGNLDSKSGQMVMETLQKLHEEEGHTIILITHETSTAEHAERIFHLKDGLIADIQKVEARRKAQYQFIK